MTPSELKEHTSSYKVLYVEDEPDLRAITTKLFKQFFTQVDTAENGKEGLEQFKKDQYDLVISDINMPILNGVEMVQQIKEINPDQSVIITSAQSDPADFITLIDTGVDKFVLKPLDLKKLIDAFVGFVLHKEHKSGATAPKVKELTDKIQSLESMLKLYNSNFTSNVWENDSKLLELEVSLHQVIFDLQMDSNISDEALALLKEKFTSYAEIVSKDSAFSELSDKLKLLSTSIEKHRTIFSTEMSKTTDFIEVTVLKLQAWREFKGDEGKLQILLKSLQKALDFLQS